MSRVRVALSLLFASVVAVVLAIAGAPTGTELARAATCADHATQAAAQAAKDTRDSDGDGIYCEGLPCPCAGPSAPAPTPTDTSPAPAPAPVSPPPAVATPTAPPVPTPPAPAPDPDPTPAPEAEPSLRKPGDPATCAIVDRTVDIGLSQTKYPAVKKHWDRAIRKGYPRVLTVNRAGTETRRAKLLRQYRTRPGKDRDEYPMAMARKTVRADVAYVDSSQNRGAGSVQGAKLRRYCSGQRFRIVWY